MNLRTVLLLIFLLPLTGCAMFEKYEEPAYTVIKKEGAVEIRQYQPHLIAEVTTTGSRDEAANEGFRHLANYIFGGNAPKEKMAMTVPVTQQKNDKGWVMHFVMPLSKTIETLPPPDDSKIKLRKMDRGKMLAIVFSGMSSVSNLDDHTAQLRSYAKQHALKIKGEPIYAFYNSPFSLPFMRRNEILFQME